MTSERTNGRTAWRRTVVVVALAALVAGACADDAGSPDTATAGVGEFEATSAYLSRVAGATEGLSYRMSMDMTIGFSGGGEDIDAGGTVMTGEVDGDLSNMTMDMSEMTGDLPGAASAGDLSQQIVTDGTTMYMRTSVFASTMLDNGASPADLGPIAPLAELDDEWGRVDLSQISLSQIAGASGGQSTDPRAYLEMAAAGTDVHELDAETIDGVETSGLGATITYGDMLDASGVGADEFRDQFSTMSGGIVGSEDGAEIYDTVMDEMFATPMPIEVWIDGDDRVRRIALDMNMAEIMAGVAEQLGEDPVDVGMSMTMSLDFSDYGDETIEIEIPETSTDVTEAFRALLDGGPLGGGASSQVVDGI